MVLTNLIDIDNFITCYLHKNIAFLENSRKRVEIYKNINMGNIGGKIHSRIKKDLEFLDELNFYENILILYKAKTNYLTKKILTILKTPIKNDNIEAFKEADRKKELILKEYLNIIKMCVPYDLYKQLNINNDKKIDIDINCCENCENIEDFLQENGVLICKRCFSEVIKMAYYNNRSYNVNISKCNYDRISHFKECLKQYQGKQNTFISPEVYQNIERALVVNSIISADSSIPTIERFKNVKKSHVIYFLKEFGYTKHYDDFLLIHINLTGQKGNDISYIEEQLICDFEKISDKYSIMYKNVSRKNFINIQFILYKLLLKHKHNFDQDDFISIKSIDKNMDRDKICKSIFESLNWEYKSE